MKSLAALSLALAPALALAQIERIEPPHWWSGMHSPELQLMVQGERIADWKPKLAQAQGVTLRGVQRVDSPNYLFLDLRLASGARGFDLLFEGPGGQQLRRHYELRARSPGSAQRQGFGPRDAIYLVVPDRFAQGVAGRPLAAGLLEGEHRGEPGGRHGGDLAGMTQALPYIAGLGFTQVWPTPLVENNSASYSYHGYAASDFYKIDPRFGSHADYLGFVAAARARGLGVIQDLVLNHIGASHRWMRDLPTPDWLNRWPEFTETNHARVSLQDPYAAPSDRERFASGWFTRNMPDLNQRHPLVATYLTQMSIWWVEEAGLSGLRTDTYSYSDRDFLSRWSARLMAEYPRLNIVGEEWSPHPAIVAYWQRGKRNPDGLRNHAPSMMDFPLHGALLASLSETDGHDSGFTKLYEALAHDFLYPAPEQLVLFEGNHDTPRLFSLLKRDATAMRMALAFMATTRRIPQFFYGDELLLESPAQRDDGRVRADFPGGWSGDAVDGFSGRGLSEEQRRMQDFVRRLFSWRKHARLVHEGALMQYAPQQGQYVLFRYLKAQPRRLMLVLNKQDGETRLPLSRFPEMTQGVTALRWQLGEGEARLQGGALVLPSRGAYLLELE